MKYSIYFSVLLLRLYARNGEFDQRNGG